MKRVAIVNGAARQFKYNKYLAEKYAEMGYTAKEFQFPLPLLFCCHLHKNLNSKVRDILDNHDVVHVESGGYFPLIRQFNASGSRKPLILECPVLRSTTGTLYAGLNMSKSYDVKDNFVIQKLLDTFCFTPEWTKETIGLLEKLKTEDRVLILRSEADTVADNRGKEHLFHHTFAKGAHGRLFFDNDFNLVKKYLEGRPK